MKRNAGLMKQELEPLVGLFRLLSDKTRLTILMMLSGGERNVTSICEELDLPQPTVSHHLGLLRMQNLISNRRNGKQVYYSLNGNVDANPSTGITVDVDKFRLQISGRTMQHRSGH